MALTRTVNNKTTVSCGGYYGELYADCLAHADDHRIVTIRHTQDDPHVTAKMFDGSCILSWLPPETEAELTNVTMSGEGAAEKIKVETHALSALRDHNGNYTELNDYLKQRNVAATPLTNGKNVIITSAATASCTLPPH